MCVSRKSFNVVGDVVNDLGETVTDKRLTTTIVLDALSEEMYSTVKIQSERDPHLRPEEIIGMMKTILIKPFGKVVSSQKESRVP